MRTRTTNNADEVLGDIESFVRDVQSQAMPAALNVLADRAETVGVRMVSNEYGLTQRDFRKYLSRVRARPGGDSEAAIAATGRGLPIHLFQPRQTKAGVTVRIKGRRVLFPHTFIARMPNGFIGVFARGAYGGKGLTQRKGGFGRFVFGTSGRRGPRRGQLPINALYTFGPAEAWRNDKVVGEMQARVDSEMGKVIRSQISRFAAGR
jgi:hypothetical protein